MTACSGSLAAPRCRPRRKPSVGPAAATSAFGGGCANQKAYMSQTYNIYCDESCHLEKDRQRAMVLGAVWCPLDKAQEIAVRLREIKAHHGMKPGFETKWTKVSPAKKQFYLDVMDYFFDDDDLHFRALVGPEKKDLQHAAFGLTCDQGDKKLY